MKQNVTPEAVLEALRKVKDPELNRDLVSLNMIRGIEVDGGKVKFTVMLTTPACPLKSQIEEEARQAVEALPGVSEVEVNLKAEVPNDGRVRGLLRVPVRNAVAVASGKGGVGKSTVAVNVAVTLAQRGAKVGLLDADIYGPNIPTMLGLSRQPEVRDGKIIPLQKFDVQVMSIGFIVNPGQPLIWRGPMLHSVIQQFLTDVAWSELDYLIIDLPPGTGDAQLSLSQSLALSGGLIVTTPQQVSLDDARRGLEMFRALEVPVLGVIENMSYLEMPDGTRMDVFGMGGGRRLAEERGVPFLGEIPIDPAVCMGGDDGNPVVISAPDSVAAKALRAIADTVAARVSVAALRDSSLIPADDIA
ncbi:MAG: Mrp/NBP35 family ATP-binding protein [Chloroflexota bacterium]